jgi:crotonobetainyl-CoA:carnitine CoA-transferase CaiB-like acyl-CoA transferase
MDLPLAGIVVVDLTWNLPGPYASFLLQSLGAEVWKVEPPKGDPARFMPGLFAALNRGKHGVTLDLQTEAGKEGLRELIAKADVVLEGFRPGVAARLGCAPADVHAVNPRVVYCSISAWGQDGPLREVPGHDLNAQAVAGVCHLARDGRDRPHGLALPVADLSAATNAVASITAALYARSRDGKGRVLDVAMLDGAVSWASVWGRGVDLAGDTAERMPSGARRVAAGFLKRLDRERLHAMPHYACYRCADGRWVAVGVVDERHFWTALCEGLGLGRLAGLPMPARVALGPVLKRVLSARFRSRTAAAWVEDLAARGVPISPVLSPEEALDHPQVRARMVSPDGTLRSPLAGAAPVTGEVPGR